MEHLQWSFFAEILNSFKVLTIFSKKSTFDWVGNRLLTKGLKYWAYSCSQSTNEAEKKLTQEICVTLFLQRYKVVLGKWTEQCRSSRAKSFLTLSWQSPLSYRNQFVDWRSKSMDWFLYDNGLCHERVKKGFMRIFAEFTKKHLCRNLFFDKVKLCRSATSLKSSL